MNDIVKFPGETDWFAFTECMGFDINEEDAFRDFIKEKSLDAESLDIEALKKLYITFSKGYKK